MEEVLDKEYGLATNDRDPEVIRAFLENLSLTGEIVEGGDGSWAVVGDMVMYPNDTVDLFSSWSDFKHDLSVLKDAGISTIYGANQAPDPSINIWVISINANSIP